MPTRNRHHSLPRAVLVVTVIAVVVLAAFPVIAAVGDNLILGKPNTADATTFLTGAAPNSNLRIINSQAGAPALDLRVQAGSPPLQVNSAGWIRFLNADRLDGKHAAAFSLVGHDHDGTYSPLGHHHDGTYSPLGHDHAGTYSPLGHDHAGVYLPVAGKAADADLLDGQDSSAFAAAGHNHTGAYLPVAGKAADADKLDGFDSTAFSLTGHDHTGTYLPVAGKAADADLLDGHDSAVFARRGVVCPPGQTLVGYGRQGPLCSRPVGSAAVDSTGVVGRETSMVLDASGWPVISYYDATNGDLKLLRCGNAACSSGNTVSTVDSTGDTGRFTSLVLDASGWPVISYYDQTNGDLKLARCGNATCSSGNTLTTVDATGNVGQHTSLALDANGYPVISYYHNSNQDLRLARCGDATCTSGNALTTVDATGVIGLYTSLVLDAAGYPVISYYDWDNGDLRLARCGDATCTSGNTLRTVDDTGASGWYTSLALDAGDYPVISHYDAANGDLRLARCGHTTCDLGNTLTIVDSSGDVGHFTSLVLNANGWPVISYNDWTNGDLKVARCGNPTCSSGNAFTTVDATGTVGQHTSLVLDADGNPVISYYDATNGDLKVAALIR
ncbi:MAG: hypothetical protein FJW79_07485 [Actinobacteria bacterium]|nr:hypothetical protein [Actinomycetota bacterium]